MTRLLLVLAAAAIDRDARLAGHGLPVVATIELLLFLNQQRPGDRLTLSIVREGRLATVSVILGTMSTAALAARRENLIVARQKRSADAAMRRPH